MIDGHSLGLPLILPVCHSTSLSSLPPPSSPSDCHSTWWEVSGQPHTPHTLGLHTWPHCCAQLGCQLTTERAKARPVRAKNCREGLSALQCTSRSGSSALQLGKNRGGRTGRSEEPCTLAAAAYSCGRPTGRIGPQWPKDTEQQTKILKCIQKMHFKRKKAHIRENTKCNQKAERHTAIVLTLKKCNRFDKSSTSAGTVWIVEDTARMFYFRIFDFRRFTSQSNYSIFCQELFLTNFHK